MSTNLLELLNAHLTEDVVSKIAYVIGESPKNTGLALGSALPSLLSGLIHKSTDSQGASILFNLLTQNHDSGLLSNLGASLVGGDVTSSLINTGTSLLASIFGNKSESIANIVASSAGINKSASTGLLGLLMPVIFAVLGKVMNTQHINSPSGLVSLLGDQGSFLKNLLPAGLLGALGISSADFGAIGANSASATSSTAVKSVNMTKSKIEPLATATTAAVAATALAGKSKVEATTTPISTEKKVNPVSTSNTKDKAHKPVTPLPPPVEDDDEDTGIFGKLLPWLILGSILALGWGIWQNLRKSTDALPKAATTADVAVTNGTGTNATDASVTSGTAVPATDTASSSSLTGNATSATPAADPSTTAPAIDPNAKEAGSKESSTSSATGAGAAGADATGKSTEGNSSESLTHKLPSGVEIKASSSSMESKLFAFVNDSAAKIEKDKWFTMDGITFDTNKATLRPESKAQMDNIIEIMKAFKAVKIKIGGYTDNTGNPKANKKLSADRSQTIKKALIKAGISKSRLDAEGYGSEHPVASNDTAEGRQQNRRIDVRVTAK